MSTFEKILNLSISTRRTNLCTHIEHRPAVVSIYRLSTTLAYRQSIRTIMNTCRPSRMYLRVRGKCRTDAKLLAGSQSSPCHVYVLRPRVCAKGRESTANGIYRKVIINKRAAASRFTIRIYEPLSILLFPRRESTGEDLDPVGRSLGLA